MFDLRNALPFLLSRIGLRTETHFAVRELDRHDVSLPMYRVLATLARHEELRLGELATLADLEVSTLSRLIGTMQARRLVSRRRSGTDARAVRIRLSDQGRTLAEKLIAAATSFEAAVTRNLAPRQMQELKRVLAQIDDAVAALEAGHAARAKIRPVRRQSAA